MSYNFNGIKPETIELLCQNRFEDSKQFYEEHKEEIKQGATVPMRQIVLDLSEMMLEIDEKMYVEPVYTVSRIRRDTRRSKNKMMYRENLWLMIRRNKKDYPCAPMFWFEFTPNGYSYGIAIYGIRPYQFDVLRHKIIDESARWNRAVSKAKKADLNFATRDEYKKDRFPDAAKGLQKYLNAKNMEFGHYDEDLSKINSSDLIDELKNAFEHAKPIYKFFIEAYDMMDLEEIV